jgi:alkylated DNA repair dioxygenase AlkB
VIKSRLPSPEDPCWEPRGWPHWKSILQVVKLLSHVPLLEATELPTAEAVSKEDVAIASVEKRTRHPKPLGRTRAQILRGAAFSAAVGEAGRKLSVATASSVVVGSGTAPPTTVPSASPRPAYAPDLRAPIGCVGTAPPLKLNFRRRIPYGPNTSVYPDPTPLSHLQRLLHVVAAAIVYVQMKYRGRDLARQKDFQSDNIAGSFAFYEYTGSVPDVWHLGEWSTELLELRDALREATGEPVNSMVANQYLDRDASIGDHSDKTPDIKRHLYQAVSLGATRVCELRKIVDDGSEPLRVELTHGSVFQIADDECSLHPQHPAYRPRRQPTLWGDLPHARLSMAPRRGGRPASACSRWGAVVGAEESQPRGRGRTRRLP